MAGAVVELLGWPGGNIRVGVALCWINPLRPTQIPFALPLLNPSGGNSNQATPNHPQSSHPQS
jgi:outer membrane protein assembly factor BamA